jgi:hypothetical protein
MRGTVPEDVGKCVRTFVADQEHAPVGLIGIAQPILGIVDGHGLPALGQRLHNALERFVIWL